jgi:hypothetical protein
MKIISNHRVHLTTKQKMDSLVDAVIDTLHKVVKRYEGTNKVLAIQAALADLIASRQGADELTQAIFYTTSDWISGPAN